MNFAAGGGARPTPGKMDTNVNEIYIDTEGSHFKWKPQQQRSNVTVSQDRDVSLALRLRRKHQHSAC